VDPPSRGFLFDADHPQNEVLIPCRFTPKAPLFRKHPPRGQHQISFANAPSLTSHGVQPGSVEYGPLNSVSVGVRPAVRILFPPPAGRADRVPQKQIELAKAGRNILSLNHRLDFYLEKCSAMRPRTDSGRLAGPQDVGAKGHRALVPKRV
jgi:hypothetical protein